MKAHHMYDNEKDGVTWIGAFGVRRLKREAARMTRKKATGRRKTTDLRKQPYLKFRERMHNRRSIQQIPPEYENHIFRLVCENIFVL